MVECNLAKVKVEGSNPFFRSFLNNLVSYFWISDRVVEGASLENWSIFIDTGGSNPSLSEILFYFCRVEQLGSLSGS